MPRFCMNEEQVSVGLFLAASEDPGITGLSWQSVDGKGYVAADVKFRLPDGQRVVPDLVVCDEAFVWLIEIKATHLAAISDEQKLVKLVTELGEAQVLSQLRRRVSWATIPSAVFL